MNTKKSYLALALALMPASVASAADLAGFPIETSEDVVIEGGLSIYSGAKIALSDNRELHFERLVLPTAGSGQIEGSGLSFMRVDDKGQLQAGEFLAESFAASSGTTLIDLFRGSSDSARSLHYANPVGCEAVNGDFVALDGVTVLADADQLPDAARVEKTQISNIDIRPGLRDDLACISFIGLNSLSVVSGHGPTMAIATTSLGNSDDGALVASIYGLQVEHEGQVHDILDRFDFSTNLHTRDWDFASERQLLTGLSSYILNNGGHFSATFKGLNIPATMLEDIALQDSIPEAGISGDGGLTLDGKDGVVRFDISGDFHDLAVAQLDGALVKGEGNADGLMALMAAEIRSGSLHLDLRGISKIIEAQGFDAGMVMQDLLTTIAVKALRGAPVPPEFNEAIAWLSSSTSQPIWLTLDPKESTSVLLLAAQIALNPGGLVEALGMQARAGE